MPRCFSWVVALLVVLVPRAAGACSCMGGIPACEAAWQVDAVFVAQVVRVEAVSMGRRVHLQPLESFRGPANIVSVETGLGGGDCGYAFRVGETYLIYGQGNPATGRYSTGICSRTRPIAEAAEDLDYLRTTARLPSNLGLVHGTVIRSDPNYGETPERRPLPGIRVLVSGSDANAEVRTDQQGRYEVQLPPGEYTVNVEVPTGLYDGARVRRAHLRNARGCARADVLLMSDGRIKGRVVDARGQPVADLPLELLTRRASGFSRVSTTGVLTGADGTYEFERVGPGAFYVAFDTLRPDPSRRGRTVRLFLPGTLDDAAAEVIQLRPVERVTVRDLVMPEGTGSVRVSGRVRTSDGQAVSGARVYLRIVPPTSLFFFVSPAITNERGEFALIVPGDPVYHVIVELPDNPQATRGMAQPIVRPSHGVGFIDVVIPARQGR